MPPEDQRTVPTAPPNGSRFSGSGVWVAPTVEELLAKLPQYEVLDVLGRGGMGAVYKARQKSLKRLVAIKILPLAAADDEMNFAVRFRHEAETMAQMNHPAIVDVYDFGETQDGLLYFVMEFVDGTDVQQLIKANGRLEASSALTIAAHVCDALHYAHHRGVIHRDIKPANVLIDRDGQIKVADFGLAKVLDDPAVTSGFTQSSMAMGTPDYVAPEVLTPGLVPDHRADIYAVGVMLYQMLTGDIPRGMFKLPSLKFPGSDPRFDAIICKALEHDREERFQTALDVRKALDAIQTTPLVPEKGQEAAPSRRQAGQEGSAGIRFAASQLARHGSRPEVKDKEPNNHVNATGRDQEADRNVRRTRRWLVGIGASVVAIGGFMIAGGTNKPASPAMMANPTLVALKTGSVAQTRTVDLLPLVDVTRNALVGQWSKSASGISVTVPSGVSVLELPYQPPEEYDFEIEFTPNNEGLNVNQYLSAGGRSFAWKLNAHARTPPLYGFELLDGKFGKDLAEAATTIDVAIEPGRRYRSTVEVRRGRLRALLDGKELVNWSGDFRRLSMENISRLRDDRHLGIGSWKRDVTFHKIEVREITGPGRVDAEAEGVVDWLKTLPPEANPWSAEWGGFEDGILTPPAKFARQFGIMRDGAVRVRVRLAPEHPVTSATGPQLQLDIRNGPLAENAKKTGQFQFQVYVPNRTCSLIYQEQDTPGGPKTPPERLISDKPLGMDAAGNTEVDWEFRVRGDEFSAWADGQLVGTVRDPRVPSGICTLSGRPGMQITRLETVGIQPIRSSNSWIDHLKLEGWTAPWVFENNVLKATTQDQTHYLGTIRNGAVRVRLREDPSSALSPHSPPLQVSFRRTIYDDAAPVKGAYQFQVIPAKRVSSLVYLERRDGIDEPPVYLWKDKPYATDGSDIELECRADGNELTLTVGGREIAAARDSRVAVGSCVLLASPGVQITGLETSGVTPPSSAPVAPASAPITSAPVEAPKVEEQWNDWLGPRLATPGNFQSGGWIREREGVTTAEPMKGTPIMPAATRDGAIRIRYLDRESGGASITIRDVDTGSGRAFYVAGDNGRSVFLARRTGESDTRLAKQDLPEDIRNAAQRTLEFRFVGDQLTATVNGSLTITATDRILKAGTCAVVVHKGSLLQGVETQVLGR